MRPPLVIVIDESRHVAAYEQIAAQIREAIATGALDAGDPLPGVRSVASDLGVNLNTVARAYRLLEDQGFVRIRHRSGVEVTTPPERVAPETRTALEEELWGLLVRMRQSGIAPAELKRIVTSQLDRLQ